MWYQEKPTTEHAFLNARRSILLSYPTYEEVLEDRVETIETVDQSLQDKQRVDALSPERPMMSAQIRALDALDYLHLQFSAGLPASQLREAYPNVVRYWDDFAYFHERYHRSNPAGHVISHLTLGDEGYWRAIRLTAFAVLLGREELLGRLCLLWDYGNQPLDGLLERLVAPFVPGRAEPPSTCTRHLPYFKLLKVFDAEPDKRPALVAKYMDEWYEASRREPYYNSHTKGRNHNYLGYWSFEAAAVTVVLGIDDSSYRDHEFYPKDLADFARSHGDSSNAGPSGSPGIAEPLRLRCPGGEPCPREGWWFTPAKQDSRRHFKAGEVMPQFKRDWGDTIWQLDSKQD